MDLGNSPTAKGGLDALQALSLDELEDEDLETAHTGVQRGLWNELWDLFHHLEKTWSVGDEDAKVVALRELFAQIADLELQIKQKNKEASKMRVRHVCAAAPALHRIRLARFARFPRIAFNAWRLLAGRASYKKISGSNDEVKHAINRILRYERLPEAVCVLYDIRCFMDIGRKWLRFWHLRSKGIKGLNRLGEICVKNNDAQDQMRNRAELILSFAEWRRWTKEQPHERWRLSAKHVAEELTERLQRHVEETTAIRRQAEYLAIQNEAMGKEVTQTQEAIGIWLTACGASPDSPDYPLGVLAARAANQRHLSQLHQQRTEIANELNEVSAAIQPLMERMDASTKSVESIQWHIANRGGSSGSQVHHEQQLVVAQRSQDSMRREVSMVQAKQTRLQEKLDDADAAIQDATLRAEESLQLDLHEAQKYVEKVLNSLRAQVRECRDRYRIEESDNERMKALLEGEKTRWLAQTESDRNLWTAKLNAARERSRNLEYQIHEAKLWVDHLKHQSSHEASKNRAHLSQQTEITEIKEALTDLADINVEILRSRGHSPQPNGMYPRSASPSPDRTPLTASQSPHHGAHVHHHASHIHSKHVNHGAHVHHHSSHGHHHHATDDGTQLQHHHRTTNVDGQLHHHHGSESKPPRFTIKDHQVFKTSHHTNHHDGSQSHHQGSHHTNPATSSAPAEAVQPQQSLLSSLHSAVKGIIGNYPHSESMSAPEALQPQPHDGSHGVHPHLHQHASEGLHQHNQHNGPHHSAQPHHHLHQHASVHSAQTNLQNAGDHGVQSHHHASDHVVHGAQLHHSAQPHHPPHPHASVHSAQTNHQNAGDHGVQLHHHASDHVVHGAQSHPAVHHSNIHHDLSHGAQPHHHHSADHGSQFHRQLGDRVPADHGTQSHHHHNWPSQVAHDKRSQLPVR